MNEFKKLLLILAKIVLFCVMSAVIFTYVLGCCRMEGNNMFPSVRDGDLCITYKLENYNTNDVVFYRDSTNELRLGRIIAIEGQTIEFPENGGYLINGYHPSEDVLYQTFADVAGKVKYPLKIEKDMYFIMNDFRSDLQDSRQFGTINESQLYGKVIFIMRRRGF